MPRKYKRPVASMLIPAAPPDAIFHNADVLYALEWAATAPGIGGWNVLLDDDKQTRKLSVVPPGSEHPTFFHHPYRGRGDRELAAHHRRAGRAGEDRGFRLAAGSRAGAVRAVGRAARKRQRRDGGDVPTLAARRVAALRSFETYYVIAKGILARIRSLTALAGWRGLLRYDQGVGGRLSLPEGKSN